MDSKTQDRKPSKDRYSGTVHRPFELAVVITLYSCGSVCRRRQLDPMNRLKAVSNEYNTRT